MVEKQKALDRAKRHIFSTGVGDSTSSLCLTSMKYGLAKFHWVQKKYGFKPNATFITSPDETITRNVGRWERNISYGGQIQWGSGKDKLIMLDVKPNACGMIVVGLDELPKGKDVVKAVYDLEHKEHMAYGVPIDWDMYKSNHYLNILEVDQKETSIKLPPYLVILHAGAGEIKGKNPVGPGLYHDEPCPLRDMMIVEHTPFGKCSVLVDDYVKEYMDFHAFAVKFAMKRREIAMQEIFGVKKPIINTTHQYLMNQNTVSLGAYHFTSEKHVFPMSLRGDLPSYLLRGKKNFNKEQMELLGFEERANRLGVSNRLRNANILPHGSGYAFPNLSYVDKVYAHNGYLVYEIVMANGRQREIVHDIRQLEYNYRGMEVINRTLELGLGVSVAKLHPIYSLKI